MGIVLQFQARPPDREVRPPGVRVLLDEAGRQYVEIDPMTPDELSRAASTLRMIAEELLHRAQSIGMPPAP